MRRAINTPPRGIGPKTELALQTLVGSARLIPGLENITGPECLMALLETQDLDDLQKALLSSSLSNGAAAEPPQDGVFGGGVGVWPEDGNDAAQSPAVVSDGGSGDGWRGFSVDRSKMLGKAMLEGKGVEGPTKAQANKLRVFAKVLCRLRVVAASQGVPEVLRVVLNETDMQK